MRTERAVKRISVILLAAGGGKAALKTVQGGTLTIEEKNGKFWVIDAKGDCLLLAQSGRHYWADECPLLGGKADIMWTCINVRY
jgi:hypothetical protein